MASDLIYREDAKVFVRHACYKKINPIDYLDEVPAADVVEVVRCRDCKHYKESKLLGPTKFCYFYKIGTGLNTADEDFCSKGERRELNLDTTKGERRDESNG